MMHGGLSNSDLLEALTDALAQQYRVVAFDRRGHGRTADTNDAFHYNDMATEAIGVLEILGQRAIAHTVVGPMASSPTWVHNRGTETIEEVWR